MGHREAPVTASRAPLAQRERWPDPRSIRCVAACVGSRLRSACADLLADRNLEGSGCARRLARDRGIARNAGNSSLFTRNNARTERAAPAHR